MKKTLVLLFLFAFALPALAGQPPCSSCSLGPSAEAEAFFAAPPAAPPAGMPAMMQQRMMGGAGAPGMMQGGMMSGAMPMGPQMGHQMGQMWRGMPTEGGAEEAGMLAALDISSLQAELALTDAQVAQLRAIYRPLQKEAVGLAAKMKVAEMELLDLMDADKSDLKAVEGRIRESESVRSQLRLGRVTAWEKAKALLTPDQRRKLEGVCLTPCGKPCNPGQCGQMPCGMQGGVPGQMPGGMPGMPMGR